MTQFSFIVFQLWYGYLRRIEVKVLNEIRQPDASSANTVYLPGQQRGVLTKVVIFFELLCQQGSLFNFEQKSKRSRCKKRLDVLFDTAKCVQFHSVKLCQCLQPTLGLSNTVCRPLHQFIWPYSRSLKEPQQQHNSM